MALPRFSPATPRRSRLEERDGAWQGFLQNRQIIEAAILTARAEGRAEAQQEIERLKAEVNAQKTRANANAVRATDAEERADRLQIVRDDCVRSEVGHIRRAEAAEAEVTRLSSQGAPQEAAE